LESFTMKKRVFFSLTPLLLYIILPQSAFAATTITDDTYTIAHSIAEGTLTHEEQLLFSYDGVGMLSYFWFAGHWEGLNRTLFRIEIDKDYSISFEYYLGMGIGFGSEEVWGIPLMGKGAVLSSVFNTYKIPFKRGTKVFASLHPTVEEKETTFWFVIRGVAGIEEVEVNGWKLPRGATLRLYTTEQFGIKPFQFVEIFASNNSGMVLQVTMMSESGNTHHMEGCMRSFAYAATDYWKDPFVLVSSGTEDYFGSAWGFRGPNRTSQFHFPTGGLTHINSDHSQFSAYKVHTDDPFIFSSKKGGIRFTWRNGDTVSLVTGKKCTDLYGYPHGIPTLTNVIFYAWVYEW